MAKTTFRCLKCDTEETKNFDPGQHIIVPLCPECNQPMKRIFRVGKGQQTDDLTFNVARMMTYHKSTK